MAVALTINWEGRSAKDFARVFAVAASVNDFSEVFEEIAQDIISPSIKQNFEVGGRPPWRPLADSTIQRKSAEGVPNPAKILVHSGAMETAATDHYNYQITKDEMRAAPWGIHYWGYHQVGDGVPKRVIMMLQAADRSAINRAFANFFRQFMVIDKVTGARSFTSGP